MEPLFQIRKCKMSLGAKSDEYGGCSFDSNFNSSILAIETAH